MKTSKKKAKKASEKIVASPKFYGGGPLPEPTYKFRGQIPTLHFPKRDETMPKLVFTVGPGTGKQHRVGQLLLSFVENMVEEEKSEPPRFAEYLAHFLPKSHRESLLGDLVETYPKLKARQGKRRAWFWAYSQVGMSMWSLWGQAIIKWGLIAWLGDMIRRFTR